MNFVNFISDSDSGIRSGGATGIQASVSRSRCAAPREAATFFASVDFPDPEFPKIRILLNARLSLTHNASSCGAKRPPALTC